MFLVISPLGIQFRSLPVELQWKNVVDMSKDNIGITGAILEYSTLLKAAGFAPTGYKTKLVDSRPIARHSNEQIGWEVESMQFSLTEYDLAVETARCHRTSLTRVYAEL